MPTDEFDLSDAGFPALAAQSKGYTKPLSVARTARLTERKDRDYNRLDLFKRVEIARQVADAGSQAPVFGTATISLATNVTHADTVTIGGDVYEFINTSTGTEVAADTNIAVLRGAAAANTITNLIAAINGTADAEHASVTLGDGETPALGTGTEPVYAVASGTHLVVTYTGHQGVAPSALTLEQMRDTGKTAMPSLALSDTLTASVAWSGTNLNTSTLFNPALSVRRIVSFSHTLTAAEIASGKLIFFVPGFASSPISITVSAFASGIQVVSPDDTVVFSSGVLTVTLVGTGGENEGYATGTVLNFTVSGYLDTAAKL